MHSTQLCTCTHTRRERRSTVAHMHSTQREVQRSSTHTCTHTTSLCYTHTHVYMHTYIYTHTYTHMYVYIHTSIYVLYYTSHYYTVVILYYYYNNTLIQKPDIGARTAVARLIGPIVNLAQKRLAKSGFILYNLFSRKGLTN